ncbi:MAG: hypothetical protein K9M15_01040 [Candidatus Marinimicrobia bacterium]|nr:hypothetical protein [Candidatus Neomarinimicrobiota bacterium]
MSRTKDPQMVEEAQKVFAFLSKAGKTVAWILIIVTIGVFSYSMYKKYTEKKKAPPSPQNTSSVVPVTQTDWIFGTEHGENLPGKLKKTRNEISFSSPSLTIEAYSPDGKVYEGDIIKEDKKEKIHLKIVSRSAIFGWTESRKIVGLARATKTDDLKSGQWTSYWMKFPEDRGRKFGGVKGRLLKKTPTKLVFSYKSRSYSGIQKMDSTDGVNYHGKWEEKNGNWGKIYFRFVTTTTAIGWQRDSGKGKKIPTIFFKIK